MSNRTGWIAALGVLALLGAGGAVGCGDAAADELEVTYYYLPG